MSKTYTAYELAPYTGSRDYGRLADLARTGSIICMVDYDSVRDVARTNYFERPGQTMWSVSARGICYVTAFSRDDFIALCAHANLEFIEPTSR